MDLILSDFLNAADGIPQIVAEEMERGFLTGLHSSALAFGGDSGVHQSFRDLVENMKLTEAERAEKRKRAGELERLKEKYAAAGVSDLKVKL